MGPLGGLGAMEIILIFLVVLLLFGARRLPEIGSSLGKGIREFKSSLREIEGEFKGGTDQVSSRSQSQRIQQPQPPAEPTLRTEPNQQDAGAAEPPPASNAPPAEAGRAAPTPDPAEGSKQG